MNARLRYLVSTAASYEEARKLAAEAEANGVELDMQSYILLSTLFKPEMAAGYEAMAADLDAKLQEFANTFVPDSEFLTASFETIKSAKDTEMLHDTINFIFARHAKLDVASLDAMFNAFNAANEGPKAIETFHKLHKAYLIDTPTFDTFLKLRPSLSL